MDLLLVGFLLSGLDKEKSYVFYFFVSLGVEFVSF